MKIKLRRLFEIESKLDGVNLGSVKLNYAFIKTKKQIKQHIQDARDSFTIPEGHNEFMSKVAAVIRDHLDDNGVPFTYRGVTYKVKESAIATLFEKISALEEEYSDVITEFNRISEEFEKLLDTKVEIHPMQIKLDDLPDGIDPSIIELLVDIGMLE